MCDSRATVDHCIIQYWIQQILYEPGTNTIQLTPLVNLQNILLPPLLIKLSLMKSVVKAMGKINSEGFQYFKDQFHKTSSTKLKEGIFIGPQIRNLIKDNNFMRCLNILEQEA